ncbi:Chemotaxis protein CheY (fragment) [Pseudomonas sp. 8Z]
MLLFDEWRLDTVSHRLFHLDGEEVLLSGADFALLKLFLDHPQQILDRDAIGNAARGREMKPLERVVDMAVSRLRQRLRDTDKPPRLICTVRGSGYQSAGRRLGPVGYRRLRQFTQRLQLRRLGGVLVEISGKLQAL